MDLFFRRQAWLTRFGWWALTAPSPHCATLTDFVILFNHTIPQIRRSTVLSIITFQPNIAHYWYHREASLEGMDSLLPNMTARSGSDPQPRLHGPFHPMVEFFPPLHNPMQNAALWAKGPMTSRAPLAILFRVSAVMTKNEPYRQVFG